MSTLLGCLFRVVAVVVICVALFAAVLFLAGGRKTGAPLPSPSPQSATLAPTVSAGSPTRSAATANSKLAAAERAARAAPPGSHQPVSLTLSEAEVNALAVPQLEGDRDFPLQQPSIQLRPGEIVLSGRAPVGPVTLPVTVTGTIGVQNSVPVLTVTNVQASGIAAPQGVVQQLRDQLATSLRLTPADIPITVQHVDLGNQTVTISGVTK